MEFSDLGGEILYFILEIDIENSSLNFHNNSLSIWDSEVTLIWSRILANFLSNSKSTSKSDQILVNYLMEWFNVDVEINLNSGENEFEKNCWSNRNRSNFDGRLLGSTGNIRTTRKAVLFIKHTIWKSYSIIKSITTTVLSPHWCNAYTKGTGFPMQPIQLNKTCEPKSDFRFVFLSQNAYTWV